MIQCSGKTHTPNEFSREDAKARASLTHSSLKREHSSPPLLAHVPTAARPTIRREKETMQLAKRLKQLVQLEVCVCKMLASLACSFAVQESAFGVSDESNLNHAEP